MKYNKLSDIVPGQVPQVVADEYPIFVAFLQAYYKFLETQKINKNIEQFRDIDTTLDMFVAQLKTELAYAAPNYTDSKTKLYLPKLKQQFVSRGSQESFDILFRLLFDKNVVVEYPKESILRVSDGKWEQDHSIFIKVISGDPYSLLHKFVYVNTANKQIRIHVDRINTIDELNNLYEVFFSRNYYGTIFINDTITFNGVSATVVSTTTDIKIINGGSGFKVGQVFSIDTNIGSGSVIKISKVGSGGSITEVQKIDFGTGYQNNFYYTISNKSIAGSTYSFPVTSINGSPTGSSGYVDTTNGMVDAGFINKQTYFYYQNGLNTIVVVTSVDIPIVVGVPNGTYIVGGSGRDITITKDAVTLTGVYVRTPPSGDHNEIPGHHTWTFSNGMIINAIGDDTAEKTANLIRSHANTNGIIVDTDVLAETSDLVTGVPNTVTTTAEEIQTNPFFGEGNYVGDVKTQFYSNGNSVIDEDSAILYISLGAVAVYPGYYSKPDSFISGLSYIQDGNYYQDFSYVVKVDEKIETYKNAVLQFLHPVGRKMFGEFTLQNDFVLSIETVISIIRLQFPDIIYISDGITSKQVGKAVVDIFTILDLVPTLDVDKALSSTLSTLGSTNTKNFSKSLDATTLNYDLVVDNNSLSANTTSVTYGFGKSLSDSQEVTHLAPTFDVSKPLSSTLNTLGSALTKDFSKSLDATTLNYDLVVDNNSLSANTTSVTYTFGKALDDSQEVTHLAPTFDIGKALDDSQEVTHSAPTFDIGKALDDSQAVTHLAPTFDVSKPLSSTLNTLGSVLTKDFSKSLDATTLNYDLVVDNNSFSLVSLATLLTTKSLNSTTDLLLDSTIIDFSKALTDSEAIVHSVPTFDISKSLQSATGTFGSQITNLYLQAGRLETDYQTIDDLTSLLTTKPFSDTQTIQDSVPSLDTVKPFSETSINTDTGTAQLNPYYSQDYFLQDYQEGRITF